MGFISQNTEKRRNLILNGKITSTLLFLSFPTLIMGLVQSMMPVIDGLFIINNLGKLQAGAITYSGPLISMFVAVAQGLSVAGMALIGQMNGLGNFKEAKRVSSQVVLFAFLMGFITAPLLVLVAYPVSLRVNPSISHYVFIYVSLNALVLPFSFLESIYNSVKNAAGKPEATLIRMVIMLILKIIFNYLFIVIFKLEIVGAVLASLLANMIICLWMYYELFIHKGEDRLEIKGFKFDVNIVRQLIRLGLPSMITSLMLNLGFVLINNEIENYGPVVLLAQGIASNITSVCFNLPSAFGSAVTTMVSMNVGAGQGDKAKKSCLVGCIVSAITAVILIAIVVPLSPYLTVLFTRDQEVIEIANKSLGIYTYSVVGFGICMVEQGAFIGLGRTKVPLLTGFLRIWLFRYVFILLTEKYLQFYSVFWGNLFSNYMAAIITTILILRVRWVSVIPQRYKIATDNTEKFDESLAV